MSASQKVNFSAPKRNHPLVTCEADSHSILFFKNSPLPSSQNVSIPAKLNPLRPSKLKLYFFFLSKFVYSYCICEYSPNFSHQKKKKILYQDEPEGLVKKRRAESECGLVGFWRCRIRLQWWWGRLLLLPPLLLGLFLLFWVWRWMPQCYVMEESLVVLWGRRRKALICLLTAMSLLSLPAIMPLNRWISLFFSVSDLFISSLIWWGLWIILVIDWTPLTPFSSQFCLSFE